MISRLSAIYCDGNTNIVDGLVDYDRGTKERDKRLFVQHLID